MTPTLHELKVGLQCLSSDADFPPSEGAPFFPRIRPRVFPFSPIRVQARLQIGWIQVVKLGLRDFSEIWEGLKVS